MRDDHGRIPIALILIVVVLIGGAVFAFLARSGVINVPGITPEEEKAATQGKVEITPEQQLQEQLRQLINDKSVKEGKISELEERIELKDERILALEAETTRLQSLIELTDKNAVKDVAAIYEKMDAEDAVKILSKFEPEKTVLILKAMEEKKSAAILAGMDPSVAAEITKIMAGFTNPFAKEKPAAPEPTAPVPGGTQPPGSGGAATGG